MNRLGTMQICAQTHSKDVSDSSTLQIREVVDVLARAGWGEMRSHLKGQGDVLTTYRFVNLTPKTGALVLGAAVALSSMAANVSAADQLPVDLGAAATFAVLASSTATNTGLTVVNGNLGVWPGTAVTGFPPGQVNGMIHAADTAAQSAQASLTVAFNDAAGRTVGVVGIAGDLSGQTLAPGLYKSTSTLAITGDLTLDAMGDPNAVFIFQIASALTVASGGRVVLTGGASAANVFWQVGSAASLGTYSAFKGTIMAYASVTLASGATLFGRALSQTAAVTLDGNAVTAAVTLQSCGRRTLTDFDGDQKSDLAVYSPSTGYWYIKQSTTNYMTYVAYQWGLSTDVPVSGDFDGDGRADVALYRPSTGAWYILESSSNYMNYVIYQWGLSDDIAVPGDFDGDGKTDLAVYRPSVGYWYIELSRTNYTTSRSYQWGLNADIPVAGDYDGDCISDLALYRPSTGDWYVKQSNTNYTTYVTTRWGRDTDIAVPGDYDGDGRTDVGVYRPSTGTWHILLSSTSYATSMTYSWGLGADIPVPGDYDGDGRTDFVVYRPSTGYWYVLPSSTELHDARRVFLGFQHGSANRQTPLSATGFVNAAGSPDGGMTATGSFYLHFHSHGGSSDVE